MTRSNQLQRMYAAGNTELTPRYREVYAGRGEVVAQVYLGHRPAFKVCWRSPLMDSVSRLKLGQSVAQGTLEVLIAAAGIATVRAAGRRV